MSGKNTLTIDERKQLIEKYPYLIPRTMYNGEVHPDYDYNHIVGEWDLPKGWFELFLQCCEDIYKPLEDAGCLDSFRFLQVKEKFGQMRLYHCDASEEACDIISKYEFLSEQVCCVCGKHAVATTRGWICPYCDEHIKTYTDRGEIVDSLEIETDYHRVRYSGDETQESVIDCSDEWNRYLKRIECVDEA
jgi:hypothetical protein